MTEWTSKQRYRPYASYQPSYLASLKQAQQQSKYHLGYHIQPESGLLNDPNGFAFFNNQWQLFYQSFPFGPVHGLKSWQHVSSADLAHWSAPTPALQPHAPFTSQGVYSGSALPVGNRLFLMYTGNVHPVGQPRESTQLGAWMAEDGTITELSQPLIATPPVGYTAHFRDPQILQVDDCYYAVIGAQREDLVGEILLYQATQPEGPWSLVGPLDWQQGKLGYMIECPNVAFVDGHVVILLCPQGLDRNRFDYQNIYPNTYIVADAIDWHTGTVINPGPMQNFDAGFDCYATQVVNRPGDSAYAVSWMGLPEIDYPTDAEGWQGCLSVIKRLRTRNGQLIQEPVVSPLLGTEFDAQLQLDMQSVLEFAIAPETAGVIQLGNSQEALEINLSTEGLSISRQRAGIPFAQAYGSERQLAWGKGPHTLAIYIDHSTFEIFVDAGEQVVSGRMFPRSSASWRLTVPSGVRVNARHMSSI